MAPCKRQVNAHLICSSCDSWIDFAKSGCAHSWAGVQADDFHLVCRGCKTVKCMQEQVNELRQIILMITGLGKKEESRGGDDNSRGGETEESRGGENEEGRGSEDEENRGGENKESSGNVREKAGKRRKMEKGRMCNKRKINE